MSVRCSVVIPVRNDLDHLERLFESLEAQSLASEDFEVLIVDDRSSEPIDDFFHQTATRFRHAVLSNPGAHGRGRAREVGWRAASGDIVAFLDADMMPAPGWLESITAPIAAGLCDIVSGERRHVEGEHEPGTSWDDLLAHSTLGQGPGVLSRLEEALPSICESNTCLSAYAFIASNVAVRRQALLDGSGFNGLLPRFEDIELGFCLWEAGARTRYAQEATAVHLRPLDTPWYSPEELLTLFMAHPYSPVLWMHLWATESHGRGGANEPGEAANQNAFAPHRLQNELVESGIILPFEYTKNREELVDGLVGDSYDRTKVLSWIDRAISRGLHSEPLVEGGPGAYCFDQVFNLLRRTTMLIQNVYEFEHRFALASPDPTFVAPPTFDCHGTYYLWFQREAIAAIPGLSFNLALPINHGNQQNVEVKNGSVPELQAAMDSARDGLALDMPLDSIAKRGTEKRIELTYDFSFQIVQALASDSPKKRHLSVKLKDPYLRIASDIVADLRKPDDLETLEALMTFLENSVLWSFVPQGFSFFRTLDTGVGVCADQIKTLIMLCRIAGIPARQVCGTQFFPGDDMVRKQTKDRDTDGYTPFRHSWIEAYIESRGEWIPAEVRGYGRRALTAQTVPDRQLAKRITAAVYERYPFEVMYPFRLLGNAQLTEVPTFHAPPGTDPALVAAAMGGTRHTIVCTFERTSP